MKEGIIALYPRPSTHSSTQQRTTTNRTQRAILAESKILEFLFLRFMDKAWITVIALWRRQANAIEESAN